MIYDDLFFGVKHYERRPLLFLELIILIVGGVVFLNSALPWGYSLWHTQDKKPIQAVQQQPLITKRSTGDVNIRKGAGVNYDVLQVLPKNSAVEFIEVENGWAKIRFNNIEGYVDNAMLEPAEGIKGK